MSLKGKTIFIGPQEIAGFLSRSATALAEEGANILVFKKVHTRQHPNRVQHAKIYWLFADFVESISKAPSIIRIVSQFFLKLFALFIALTKADACLFIGGKSLFNFPIDYYLLRLFRKRVVHMYVGTASRPRYISAYAKQALNPNKSIANKFTAKLIKRTRRQRARINATSKAADCVIENPLCGHFQQKPFVNFFKIGLPIGMSMTNQPDSNTTTGQKIRILHCPSRPEIKGTQRIKEILTPEVLKRLNAELIVLTGVPHARIQDEISKCDFVIDQLYSDTPLAGFAAESASHKKVPLVSGYGWDEIRNNLDSEDIPPALLCSPEELLKATELLCFDSKLRERKSKQLEKFLVSGAWSGKQFSLKLAKIICNEIPKNWMVNPSDIRYKQGVGLSENDAMGIARKMIELGGIKSLQIADKPELEADYRNWLEGKS